MNISQTIQFATQQLEKIYDSREAKNITTIVIEEITGLNRIESIINKDVDLTISQEHQFNKYIQELSLHKPIQYVLGNAWFSGNKFLVNEHVLIPRPETEELVELIVLENKNSSPSILDIGTGCGCIAISLQKQILNSLVTAIDVSEISLEIVKKNMSNLSSKINLKKSNFLDENTWNELPHFNIIVSNPPYIKEEEKKTMEPNVLLHEPHVALFVPNDDALIFYRKIIDFAKNHLNPKGYIYVEINESLGLETENLFKQNNYTTLLIKDLQGKDRIVKASKN